MKKLFMFLASAAFITQAHAMEGRSNAMGEGSNYSSVRSKYSLFDNYCASKTPATRGNFFTVDNKSAKHVTVCAYATGMDDRGFIRSTISLNVGPGESNSFKWSDLRPEYRKPGVSMDRIEGIMVSPEGASKSVELGQGVFYRSGGLLSVTDQLLEKAN